MDFLDLARGPILQVSIYILIAGTLWRLLGIMLLQKKPDHSKPRGRGGLAGALKVIWTRAFTAPVFKQATIYSKTLGYGLHIGLFLTIFFFVPHILFISEVFGVSWPGLPNSAVFFIGVITIGIGVALLVKRLTHPVLKLISNFDDYFSWLVTMLPLVTGLLIPIRFGVRYETLLALHIVSVALLFTWLPFSKLAHTFLIFLSRGTTGAILERRGAKT